MLRWVFPFNVWTSMTTLQYPTCERVWRLSTFTIVNMPPFGTSHHTSLPLSFHRLYLNPSCSPTKTPRSFKSCFRGRYAYRVAMPSSLRYDGHNLPPFIFLHVGSPQVPNCWSACHGTVSNVPWPYRSDAGDSMMDIRFLKFYPTIERKRCTT